MPNLVLISNVAAEIKYHVAIFINPQKNVKICWFQCFQCPEVDRTLYRTESRVSKFLNFTFRFLESCVRVTKTCVLHTQMIERIDSRTIHCLSRMYLQNEQKPIFLTTLSFCHHVLDRDSSVGLQYTQFLR